MMEVDFNFQGHQVRMSVDPDDHIGRVIATGNTFYECAMLMDLSTLLRPGQLVVDVGGNIGNHSIFFARVAACRVVCFEPNSPAIRFLRKNIRLNGLECLIQLREEAVGASGGQASITNCPDGNLGATRFSPDPHGSFALVALDSVDFEQPVSLIKIDVEGMDFDVLLGAERLIQESRPVLAVECASAFEYGRVGDWLAQFSYVAVACYNATDTYVFLPSRGVLEVEALVGFMSRQQLRLQVQLRDLAKSVKRLTQVDRTKPPSDSSGQRQRGNFSADDPEDEGGASSLRASADLPVKAQETGSKQ